MSNATNTASETIAVFIARTPSGKNSHWFAREDGRHAYPVCNQYRGRRGNGHYRTAYGETAPNCPMCAQWKIVEQKG